MYERTEVYASRWRPLVGCLVRDFKCITETSGNSGRTTPSSILTTTLTTIKPSKNLRLTDLEKMSYFFRKLLLKQL